MKTEGGAHGEDPRQVRRHCCELGTFRELRRPLEWTLPLGSRQPPGGQVPLCSSSTHQGLRRAVVLQTLRGGEQGSEGSRSISQDPRPSASPNPTRTPRRFPERAARCRHVLHEVPAHSVGTRPRTQPAQAVP